jgi:hypothetical protein
MSEDASVGKRMAAVSAPTVQLLEWITERTRSYPETIEAWKSSCPRLTVWEDAVTDGLVCVRRGRVLLTAAGTELIARTVEVRLQAGSGGLGVELGSPRD